VAFAFGENAMGLAPGYVYIVKMDGTITIGAQLSATGHRSLMYRSKAAADKKAAQLKQEWDAYQLVKHLDPEMAA
jgi:hypothetical protein